MEKHEADVSNPQSDTMETSSHSKEGSDDVEGQGAVDSRAPKQSAFKGLGWLDRLLALWILLAMIVGVLLGNFVDSIGPALQRGEFVGVSIPIGGWTRQPHICANRPVLTRWEAIGLLVMMYPILCKVKYETLHQAFRSKELWIQVGFSMLLNWIVAPFLMVCHFNTSVQQSLY